MEFSLMPNPSSLNNSKTAKHDDIHLWLYEKENQMSVIKACRELPTDLGKEKGQHYNNKKGRMVEHTDNFIRSEYKIIDIQREVPIYSKNYNSKYLQGISDAIIKFNLQLICERTEFNPTYITNISKPDDIDCDTCRSMTCRIIVEFKPKLESISGIIGQIKVYRDCIGASHLVIVTYDQNTKYDKILESEGIKIIRIQDGN